MQNKVKRPASMASNISSEFEEVHLEEVEHSASTGSGEELEFPSGMGYFCLAHSFNLPRLGRGYVPLTEVEGVDCSSLHAGDDEVVQRQEPAVVGKNVSAPRPDAASTPGKAPDAAPVQQAATRRTPVKGEGADESQAGVTEEPDPEISWRGNRQGKAKRSHG